MVAYTQPLSALYKILFILHLFQGGGPTEKRPKLSKKYRKIALFSLFQGGPTEKRLKKGKKGRKMALLSLYLLYLYHV